MRKSNPIVDNFIKDFPQILSDMPFGLMMSEDCPDYPIYFKELKENILRVDPMAEFRFGMSKFVITAPSLKNVVIKIPFSGTYSYYYDEFDDDSHVDDADYIDENQNPYCFDSFMRTDYCEYEYEKYCNLWRESLDCFVAKTRFYTVMDNGIKVFLQEKIIPNEENWHSRKPSEASKSTVHEWMKQNLIYINNNWLANCIDVYGESKTKRFIDYCNNEDPEIIYDLHSGNLGYRMNNTPAILDFSGFFS